MLIRLTHACFTLFYAAFKQLLDDVGDVIAGVLLVSEGIQDSKAEFGLRRDVWSGEQVIDGLERSRKSQRAK